MSSRRRLFGGLGVAAAAMGVGRAALSNPFATHLLALQLSDSVMAKQREVLNNANAVLKVWPDTASIIVVAFGPGVELTFADSPLREQVDSLIAQNVEFDVCMNTIETLKRETGHTPVLNPKAKQVPYGVPRLMELAGKGYVIVRP
ncbi:unnamed protein product [Acidocella sp. C78]|uniref:DsrE family protein n=1 Tax=Acidocella sp. C78 TaxID=1671486 RepID=UPI00191B9CDD|nr:hypothetical protein [Acidocella sp. C78]CAG4906121.1 unnamed protein product [Acidocella sp. C78]